MISSSEITTRLFPCTSELSLMADPRKWHAFCLSEGEEKHFLPVNSQHILHARTTRLSRMHWQFLMCWSPQLLEYLRLLPTRLQFISLWQSSHPNIKVQLHLPTNTCRSLLSAHSPHLLLVLFILQESVRLWNNLISQFSYVHCYIRTTQPPLQRS